MGSRPTARLHDGAEHAWSLALSKGDGASQGPVARSGRAAEAAYLLGVKGEHLGEREEERGRPFRSS